MRKMIPLTAMALCALAAPALAQDEGTQDPDQLLEKGQELMQRIGEIVQPLMDKAEDTLHEVLMEVQTWMQENGSFEELDSQGLLEKLQRMFRQMPGGGDDGEEEEDEGESEEF